MTVEDNGDTQRADGGESSEPGTRIDADTSTDPSDTGVDAGINPSDTTTGTVEIDETALYGIINEAVEDAILGALGTVLIVGIGLVCFAVGATMIVRNGPVVEIVVGGAILGFGVYLVAASARVIPPVREWAN